MALDSVNNALFFTPAASTLKAETEKKQKTVEKSRFSKLLGGNEGIHTEDNKVFEENQILQKIKDMTIEDGLQVLLNEINTASEDLRRTRTRKNLDRYKDAIQAFVKVVMEKSYSVGEQTKGYGPTRRKYETVQVIDQKLAQLAEGILSMEKRRIEVCLGRMDEIRGLLLDLMT